MTQYRVHIYRPYRVLFAIEADNQQDALRKGLKMPRREAIEVEDAEGIPTGFLVDTLNPSGEIDYGVAWSGDLDGDGNPIEDVIHGKPTVAYDNARRTFLVDVLTPLAEAMGNTGANRMGDLTRAEAALFHGATRLIEDLEEMLADELLADPAEEGERT